MLQLNYKDKKYLFTGDIESKVENLYFTERDGSIWVTSDGIGEDTIQKLDKVNLDGAKSTINSNELNYEYLESILISMFFLIFL